MIGGDLQSVSIGQGYFFKIMGFAGPVWEFKERQLIGSFLEEWVCLDRFGLEKMGKTVLESHGWQEMSVGKVIACGWVKCLVHVGFMLLRLKCCWVHYRPVNCLQSPNEVVCQLSREFGWSCGKWSVCRRKMFQSLSELVK